VEIEWIHDDDLGLSEDGEYEVILKNAKGNRISTFKGPNLKVVTDKALKAQIIANQEMNKLRQPDRARVPGKIEPRTITDADRLRLSTDITDPEKVVETVTEIITAQQGVAPAAAGKRFANMDQKERDEFYAAEATAFAKAHPDYYPVPQNRDALFDELKANGWELTRNNLAIAYQTLMDREEMIPWPIETGEQNPPPTNGAEAHPNGQANTGPTPAPSPRPRSVATGIRNGDASASAPTPPKKQKYTREDIERMPRAEYNDKIRSDPEFRRQVDAM
jgi:hypothetical protein